MKLWWGRCCFWWRHTFGLDLPFPKIYNINSVICFLIVLKNSGFIASNYRKALILSGYDINKCERLCIGESAFILTRDIGVWVMGEWPVWVLGEESLLHVGVWRQSFGKPCNPLTDVNHIAKVIVVVNRAAWQVCRFPHYRLSMYREGLVRLVFVVVEMTRPSIHNI